MADHNPKFSKTYFRFFEAQPWEDLLLLMIISQWGERMQRNAQIRNALFLSSRLLLPVYVSVVEALSEKLGIETIMPVNFSDPELPRNNTLAFFKSICFEKRLDMAHDLGLIENRDDYGTYIPALTQRGLQMLNADKNEIERGNYIFAIRTSKHFNTSMLGYPLLDDISGIIEDVLTNYLTGNIAAIRQVMIGLINRLITDGKPNGNYTFDKVHLIRASESKERTRAIADYSF